MKFTKQDYQGFKTLARLTQERLKKTLYLTLIKEYGKKNVIDNPAYIYAQGNIPVALIAHMDTVFPDPPKDIYYDRERQVIWSPDGLGADDRAGVFSILKIISLGYKPHIIFTTDEECGGKGARILSAVPCPFKHLKFMVQLDRKGVDDCVFYDCGNVTFEEFIEGFGFHSEWGTYSDICELCPAWKVAGVNLSIGYIDEHSYVETLHITHMMATIEKVEQILQTACKESVPTFEFVKGNRFLLNYYVKCSKCGQISPEIEMIDVYDADYHKKYICGDCLDGDNVEWCEDCYEGFEPGVIDKYTGLCPKCLEKFKLRGGSSLYAIK